ncbi:MAG: hypothetical protein KJ558_17040, partial [Gammaproteobacteria bacterium]|nr:hypothetical protein [Gammaproteobacteria bacterium]
MIDRAGLARAMALLFIVAFYACSPEPSGGADFQAEAVELAEGEVAVARVNGVPITASRVVKLARETGRSPSEVVDRLISFELLAQEARRRGLSSHPETREATRKAMVQRYLELEFEDSHRPEDMPEAMLRDAYQQNISQFVRPKLRRVAHLLVVAPDGRFTKDQQRDAFALAQEIHREAVKVNDLDAFRGLRSVFDGRRGFEVIEEIISTSVYPGAALATNFIDAAMELDKRGEV